MTIEIKNKGLIINGNIVYFDNKYKNPLIDRDVGWSYIDRLFQINFHYNKQSTYYNLHNNHSKVVFSLPMKELQEYLYCYYIDKTKSLLSTR